MSTLSSNKAIGGVPSARSAHSRRRLYLILLGGGMLLALALLAGFVPRWQQRQQSAAATSQLGVQTVSVVSPQSVTPHSGLDLPAEVKPWQEASIYSRVNGYLKNWYVDIGAHVEQGQLLAKIDIPGLQ